MELRHLCYFVAVAEEGSLTVAAERRLHTSQPSLSRQIRDLEYEVGAELLTRGARGVELTAAGRAFLDHARLALAQADAAGEAARRAAQPASTTFAIGFQTGLQQGEHIADLEAVPFKSGRVDRPRGTRRPLMRRADSHHAGAPPLRRRCCPLTKLARSPARYSAALATSSGVPIRAIGRVDRTNSRTLSLAPVV